MPNDRLPKKRLFDEVKGLRAPDRLGLVSMMVLYMTVKNIVSIDMMRTLRTDCSGETRLALQVPSSS